MGLLFGHVLNKELSSLLTMATLTFFSYLEFINVDETREKHMEKLLYFSGLYLPIWLINNAPQTIMFLGFCIPVLKDFIPKLTKREYFGVCVGSKKFPESEICILELFTFNFIQVSKGYFF